MPKPTRTPHTPGESAQQAAPVAGTAPPGPRFAFAWASLVYVFASLTLGFPALAGKFLVNPRSDQYIAGYAFREFAATTLHATGHFPLWNPYILGGLPYVAAMHGDIFYPTFLLRMILPTDAAMTWEFIIHLFLAGLFTFAFLRAIGLGFFASLLGGLAYLLGGNVAGLASPGHDGKLFVSALLPLALLLIVRAVRDGKLWAFGALAFTVGMAVLSPHPQLLQYMLLGSGAFAILLAFTDTGQGELARKVALRRLALAGLAIGVGLAIGAIQFLPVFKYVNWSPRAGGKAWESAIDFSMPPEEVINFYLPHFSGILDLYWGRNGCPVDVTQRCLFAIHLHSEYIGAAVLVLAGLAISRTWARAEKRLVWFWVGGFVVSLLWALGGYTPFYRLVYFLVPGTKFFRAPSTMLFFISFCTAVLAAFGTERALRSGVSRRYLLAWSIAAALVLIAGVAGGLTNLGVSLAAPGRSEMVMANDSALRVGTIRTTLFVAFALGALFLLSVRRLSPRTVGGLLCAIVVVDLWSIERIYWMFSPPASVLYASDATIDYLRKQPDPARVLPLATDPDRISFHDPNLEGDGLMVHQLRSPLGYHGNELGRYQMLGNKDGNWSSVINPNFWALMNVQFILSENDSLTALGFRGITKVMGPVKDAAGTNVYLYRIQADNPAAWVTPVMVKASDTDVLNTVLDQRFDVRRAALFEENAPVQGQAIKTLPAALDVKARTTKFEPGSIDVVLDQPAPVGSALMVSENYYPGWTATVDGKPATIGRADLSLMGVALPAGAKSVSLRFASAPYEQGKTITLIALALSIAVWVAGAFVGRRASA